MNQTKPKTVFDEREQLKRQLSATEAALTEIQRANAELRDDLERLKSQYAALESFVGAPQAKLVAEIERMRRVCEAADVYDKAKLDFDEADLRGSFTNEGLRLCNARGELRKAVAEHRKQQEAKSHDAL